ncbi:FAD assembly factor SdhE [Halomonadaceae bacterium LMG 33818]|uniref:FAD assembly factor SdhE n=1 Tax=Cernens ardua TaxID=3402176 RepID=UPI003EDBEBB0
MMDERAHSRLRWHSRRGMWELDMMLMPFFDNRFSQLDDASQQAYQRLIDFEDQDLFGWLMRREPVVDPSLQPIANQIIEYARYRDEVNVRPV